MRKGKRLSKESFVPSGNKQSTIVTIIMLTCLIISSGSLGFFGYALANPDITTVIEEGSGLETASLVLSVDGSTYYAKNGSTGAIPFSSSNFTALWEDARDAVPSIGGEIVIKAGEYTTGVMLYITRSNLKITGEGYGTLIKPSATFFADNLGNNNTNVLMHLNGHSGTTPVGGIVENIEISNIRFDGEYNTFDVLSVAWNTSNVKVHDNWFYRGRARGLYVVQSWNTEVYDNYFFDCSTAMQINLNENLKVDGNHILGGYYSDIQGKGEGIYWNAGLNYTITNNVIVGNYWNTATGDYNEQTATSNSLANGITGFGGEGILIANNWIKEVYVVGIWVYWLTGTYSDWYGKASTNFPHRNVVIDSNVVVGYGYSDGSRGIQVGASGATNAGNNGTVISNNLVVHGNPNSLTTLGIAVQRSPYSIVTGNRVINTTTNGMTIYQSNYSVISNNIVTNWDYDDSSSVLSGGIFLQESSWCIIDSNILSDYQASPTGDYGIHLYDEVHYTIVSSNVANPAQTAGIMEGTSITNTKYIGNWNETVWLSGDG